MEIAMTIIEFNSLILYILFGLVAIITGSVIIIKMFDKVLRPMYCFKCDQKLTEQDRVYEQAKSNKK